MSLPIRPSVWTIGPWQATAGVEPSFDAYGCSWFVTNSRGWFEAPAPRVSPSDRPLADGQRNGRIFRTPRVITLEGYLAAPDQVALFAAFDSLSEIFPTSDPIQPLTVSESGGVLVRTADVRLGDLVTLERRGLDDATWALTIVAADPRRFGTDKPPQSTSVYSEGVGRTYTRTYPRVYGALGNTGRLTIINGGTVPADMELDILGPVTNPRITHVESGRYLEFLIDLMAGETLSIKTIDRTVLLNGQASRRGTMTAGASWFTLAPGVNTLVFNAQAAGVGALLTVSTQDTWG